MTVEIRTLSPDDDRARFDCGDGELNLFFRRYTGQNQFRHHIGVSYVAVKDDLILGFVTVSPAALDADDLPSGRRMPPYPVPVLRVARLAVDLRAQGVGVGEALLRFCLELAERMRDELGCVGLLVDAKPGTEEFYGQYGFVPAEAEQGQGGRRPRPTLMFLSLGSVPVRQSDR